MIGIIDYKCGNFASIANIIAEYTHYPLLYVLGLTLLAFKAINLIQEEEPTTTSSNVELASNKKEKKE